MHMAIMAPAARSQRTETAMPTAMPMGKGAQEREAIQPVPMMALATSKTRSAPSRLPRHQGLRWGVRCAPASRRRAPRCRPR